MRLHESPTVDSQLRAYAAMVRESPHNLVSKRARGELETRHIPECVELAELLPRGPHRLLDLGSGGGFPGMILAIVRPEVEVHLLDATAKKTAFLEQAGIELGVELTVHTGRAESMARGDLSGSFDVVTARAVAPLSKLVGWSIPFLRAGGLLCAVKGDRWAEELEEARSEIARHGASVVATPADVAGEGQTQDAASPKVVMLARVT